MAESGVDWVSDYTLGGIYGAYGDIVYIELQGSVFAWRETDRYLGGLRMNMPTAAMRKGSPKKKASSAKAESARISMEVATRSDQLKSPWSFSKMEAASSRRFWAVKAMPRIYIGQGWKIHEHRCEHGTP